MNEPKTPYSIISRFRSAAERVKDLQFALIDAWTERHKAQARVIKLMDHNKLTEVQLDDRRLLRVCRGADPDDPDADSIEIVDAPEFASLWALESPFEEPATASFAIESVEMERQEPADAVAEFAEAEAES